MKAALVLSKIKNEDLKASQRTIDEMKNNLLDLKRQVLNEVISFGFFIYRLVMMEVFFNRKKKKANFWRSCVSCRKIILSAESCFPNQSGISKIIIFNREL